MSELPRALVCAFDVVPAPTGASRRITEYLKALNGRYSVVAMTMKTQDVSHIERYQGARLLRVPVGAGDLFSKIQAFERAVRRQLESEEFIIAHAFDPFAGYPLAELRADYGYRLLYEAHSFPSLDLRYTHPQLEGDKRFVAKVRRQELFCLLNADVVATTSSLGSAYLQGLGVAANNVRLLRAPVDLGPYQARITEPTGNPMRVLYVGSQVAYQGLTTLLRAMRPLAIKEEAKLTVLGPRHPEWQSRLEDLVDDLQLTGKVELHPPVTHDELPAIFAASDVAVLPLEDEERTRVFGGALAKCSEYLAAGRPIIASDLPVTRELLPSTCTVFVPPGDATALGEALEGLAADPRKRVELGRVARAEAARLVDSAVIRPRLLDLYGEIIGRPDRHQVAAEPSGTDDIGNETVGQDPTATPTNKIYGASRTAPDAVGTPVAYLPRSAANALKFPGSSRPKPAPPASKSLAEAGAPTIEIEITPVGRGPASPTVEITPVGPEPERRAAEITPVGPDPAGAAAPEREKTDPSATLPRDHDSNITAPGVPNPEAPPSERVLDRDPRDPTSLPSVVVAPSLLAEIKPQVPAPLGPIPAAAAPTIPFPIVPIPTAHSAAPPPPPPAPQAPAATAAPPSLPAAPLGYAAPTLPSLPAVASQPAAPMAPAAPAPPVLPVPQAAALAPATARPAAMAPIPLVEEVEEIGAEEILDDDIAEGPAETGLPPSAFDPWLAQMVHGYCPPEGILFSRHTPPTTMPGRDPAPGGSPPAVKGSVRPKE